MKKRLWLTVLLVFILSGCTSTPSKRDLIPQQKTVTNLNIERRDVKEKDTHVVEVNQLSKDKMSIETVEDEVVKEKKEEIKVKETKEYIYLGEFRISFYCHCEICNGRYSGQPCKNGDYPQADYTIAVDPRVIPLNSFVQIGDTFYKAQDTGSAIKGNRIDLFVDSHTEALKLGIQSKDVYLIVKK